MSVLLHQPSTIRSETSVRSLGETAVAPPPQEISPESVAKGTLNSLFAQPLLDRSGLSGLSDLSEFRSGPFARHAGANALSDFWSEFRSSL
jgi:hypothetical protein